MSYSPSYDVSIVDRVGPLPIGGVGMFILSANGKIFAAPGSHLDMLALAMVPNPYHHAATVMRFIGRGIREVYLDERHSEFSAMAYFTDSNADKVISRMILEPGTAISFAQAFNAPLKIQGISLEKVPDASSEYSAAKDLFGQLYPLPFVSDTNSLRVLSDLVDVMLPAMEINREICDQ